MNEMNKYYNKFKIEIYDIIDNDFSVNITNTSNQNSINNIKASNNNGLITIDNFDELKSFAIANEVSCKSIIIQISKKYKIQNTLNNSINVDISSANLKTGEYIVSISKEGEKRIDNIHITYSFQKPINILFPMRPSLFPWKSITKKAVNKEIINEFYRMTNIINDSKENDIKISFYDAHPDNGTCMASISIDNKHFVDGILIQNTINNNIVVFIENVIDNWECNYLTINDVKKLIAKEFKVFAVKNNFQIYSNKKNVNLTNNLGRILIAENTNFAYYPNTTIRKKLPKKNGKPNQLYIEMSMGKNPIISSFEFDILSWVNKLRYLTKPMILDLYNLGFISKSWRNINSDKLSKVITNLEKYGLIIRNHFVSLEDNDVTKIAPFEIYTLGGNGSNLLKELGRPFVYNRFDSFQDGNIVKRYLAANQWLIFMLKNYSETIKDKYVVNKKIYLLGFDSSGARISAGVDMENKYIIGEAWRRTDPLIKETDENEKLGKLLRFMKIFNEPDNIYTNDWSKIHFCSRPIICLICEDNEHIQEVLPLVNKIKKDYPEQRFLFTTDLKVFNETVDESRFVELISDKLVDIEL